MKPNIGLDDQNREGAIEILNILLADEYVLYTKTRNYHWNVRGRHFNDLHKFFQQHYEQLEIIIDEVAERARTIGGHAVGTLIEFTQKTRLKETAKECPEAWDMVKNLLNDQETIIRNLRVDLKTCDEKYNDMGTSDFLTGLMKQHEKMAWMLREFLKATS